MDNYDDENDNICSITLSEPEKLYITKCGHKFEESELIKWRLKNNICPNCRTILSPIRNDNNNNNNNSNNIIVINTEYHNRRCINIIDFIRPFCVFCSMCGLVLVLLLMVK
jgi:hypothetical protein